MNFVKLTASLNECSGLPSWNQGFIERLRGTLCKELHSLYEKPHSEVCSEIGSSSLCWSSVLWSQLIVCVWKLQKTSQFILMHCNVIAQYNRFEQEEMLPMFKFVFFKMAICETRIQWVAWIREILVTFCDVWLHKVLFLALCMGIPINKFKLKITCAILVTCYHV